MRITPDGETRGRVPEDPQAPPALPPVVLPRRRAGSSGISIDQVVREMARAYVGSAGERRSRELLRQMDGPWRHVVRLMASDLMDEGRSPAAFVRFVCAKLREKRGRAPFAAEVFSMRAFGGWLPQYRREASSWIDAPSYTASPARRRQHAERRTWRATV